MSPKLHRVRSFGADGTVVLEDGREMSAVVSDTGALGVRPRSNQDRLSTLDQVVEALPQMIPVGLAVAPPPPGHFETGALDQAG